MKIRIRGNTVRLRLTMSEVEHLKTEGEVSEKTDFASEDFIYRLVMKPVEKVDADMVNGRIVVTVPESEALQWATTDQVGIESETDNGVFILVEKDFKCLTERIHEDESDMFENPNETC